MLVVLMVERMSFSFFRVFVFCLVVFGANIPVMVHSMLDELEPSTCLVSTVENGTCFNRTEMCMQYYGNSTVELITYYDSPTNRFKCSLVALPPNVSELLKLGYRFRLHVETPQTFKGSPILKDIISYSDHAEQDGVYSCMGIVRFNICIDGVINLWREHRINSPVVVYKKVDDNVFAESSRPILQLRTKTEDPEKSEKDQWSKHYLTVIGYFIISIISIVSAFVAFFIIRSIIKDTTKRRRRKKKHCHVHMKNSKKKCHSRVTL